MGRDIHMFIEYKPFNTVDWIADKHHTVTFDDSGYEEDEYLQQSRDRVINDYNTEYEQFFCWDSNTPIGPWFQHTPSIFQDHQIGYNTNVKAVECTTRTSVIFNIITNNYANLKGLPRDVSEVVWSALLLHLPSRHSHSWLTMAELERCAVDIYFGVYDKIHLEPEAKEKMKSLVQRDTNCFYQNKNAEMEWSLYSLPGYISIHNYCKLLSKARGRRQVWPLKRYAANTIHKCNISTKILPTELKEYVAKHTPNDVRVVYWFDS